MFGITADKWEIDDYKKLLASSLKYLDLKLSTSPYICGTTPSIADISAVSEIKGLGIEYLNYIICFNNFLKLFFVKKN